MTGENRRDNIAAELAKARRAADAARRNAAASDFDTAMNRLYYAAYHTVVAVLLSEGLEPKTHRGATHLLKLHFVVPGFLADWVESAFSRLQTERDLADYEPEYTVTAPRYEDRRVDAEKLIAELDRLLSSRRPV